MEQKPSRKGIAEVWNRAPTCVRAGSKRGLKTAQLGLATFYIKS